LGEKNLRKSARWEFVAEVRYEISDDLISAIVPRGVRGRRPFAA
jgi:hypothetical protein